MPSFAKSDVALSTTRKGDLVVTRAPIVRPLVGLRYARNDLGAILAPPYDTVSGDEQERLYRRDPHNVVRLELGRAASGDSDEDNRYTRAARTLEQWRQDGVLRYDEGPCLYPCAHDFPLRGDNLTRVGVFCAVRLTRFEQGLVLPHEGTLRGPREDRRQLMLACQAQISPVFIIHDDTDGQIGAVISQMMARQPVVEAATDGQRHRLWRCPQGELTQRYCELVGQGPLFIADGHHRYETALTVSDELGRAYRGALPQAAFNHVLALLCHAQQPGVVILPTHRLVRLRSQDQRARLENLVNRHFTRHPVAADGDPLSAARTLIRRLDEPGQRVRFGIYTADGGCALLSPKPECLSANPGRGGYNQLATVVIHRLLVDPVVEPHALSECVDYVTDEAEAVRRVDEGSYQCALFLRPTTVEQVKRVASAGLRMPGKSTYFYPKVPAGLVMSDISPGRTVP